MEEKKKAPLLRFLTLLLTAALLLGAVFLIANWQKLNFDFIRRWFAYRSLEKNESGQVESYRYIGGVDSSFVQLGDDLLVSSESGVRLYSPSGAAYVDQPCVLTHPFVSTGGNAALVYDAGGTDLFIYRDRERPLHPVRGPQRPGSARSGDPVQRPEGRGHGLLLLL